MSCEIVIEFYQHQVEVSITESHREFVLCEVKHDTIEF